MSKLGADPSSGISLGDALRLPKRHPACRRREATTDKRARRQREAIIGDVDRAGIPYAILKPVLGTML